MPRISQRIIKSYRLTALWKVLLLGNALDGIDLLLLLLLRRQLRPPCGTVDLSDPLDRL